MHFIVAGDDRSNGELAAGDRWQWIAVERRAGDGQRRVRLDLRLRRARTGWSRRRRVVDAHAHSLEAWEQRRHRWMLRRDANLPQAFHRHVGGPTRQLVHDQEPLVRSLHILEICVPAGAEPVAIVGGRQHRVADEIARRAHDRVAVEPLRHSHDDRVRQRCPCVERRRTEYLDAVLEWCRPAAEAVRRVSYAAGDAHFAAEGLSSTENAPIWPSPVASPFAGLMSGTRMSHRLDERDVSFELSGVELNPALFAVAPDRHIVRISWRRRRGPRQDAAQSHDPRTCLARHAKLGEIGLQEHCILDVLIWDRLEVEYVNSGGPHVLEAGAVIEIDPERDVLDRAVAAQPAAVAARLLDGQHRLIRSASG